MIKNIFGFAIFCHHNHNYNEYLHKTYKLNLRDFGTAINVKKLDKIGNGIIEAYFNFFFILEPRKTIRFKI